MTPWTAVHQAPLSMRFSRQRYWSGLPFPSPGDLPNPGIEPGSPALPAYTLPTELQGKPIGGYKIFYLIDSYEYDHFMYKTVQTYVPFLLGWHLGVELLGYVWTHVFHCERLQNRSPSTGFISNWLTYFPAPTGFYFILSHGYEMVSHCSFHLYFQIKTEVLSTFSCAYWPFTSSSLDVC